MIEITFKAHPQNSWHVQLHMGAPARAKTL